MSKVKKNRILQATDHLVSGDSFSIHWDSIRHRACTDVEHLGSLDAYYESSDYISHRRKPYSNISLLYAWARGFMLKYKYVLLKKYLKQKSSVLDIGCGTGAFLDFMKNKGFEVLGVESNKKARNICVESKLQVNATEEGLVSNSFDMISLWHVLEHLPEPEERLAAYRDLLKPGGLLVIAVPNFESHDRTHYQQDWAALDVPRHLWHFTPKGLIMTADESGFDLIKKRALGLDVFYICFLSEKFRGKSMAFLRGMLKGLLFSLKSIFTGKHSSLVFVFRKRLP